MMALKPLPVWSASERGVDQISKRPVYEISQDEKEKPLEHR